MAVKRGRTKWFVLWYPILGLLALDLAYQSIITWHQAHVLARAQPLLLVIAVFNQLCVYVVLLPAMQRFYAAAGIKLSSTRVFALLATGLAFARVVPVGEYLVWRATLHRIRGAVSATTQWLIMYYSWMFGGLLVLFFAGELLTLTFYPNAHVNALVGYLRFVPIILSGFFLLGLLATRLSVVRKLLRRIAYDRLGSQAVSPVSIIRERSLGRVQLPALTFAALGVWLLESLTMYLCFLAMGLDIPPVLVMFGFAFARIFSLVPLTPGGIGEIEAGTALFFSAYGYPLGAIFTATILYRVITYWPALIVGVTVYLASGTNDAASLAQAPVYATQLHRNRG